MLREEHLKGEFQMARTTKKHMTQQDKIEWEALYTYVRKNIMGYDENQSLSRSVVLRLKGLASNKFMENNNISDTANYSYQVILNTFKFCTPDIQKALRNNTFRDENHKVNYILKIVESNLNTVYMRMKQAKQVKEEVESHDVSNAVDYVNRFKSKESSINKKYDDLW